MSCQRGWYRDGGEAALQRRILITLTEQGGQGQYPQCQVLTVASPSSWTRCDENGLYALLQTHNPSLPMRKTLDIPALRTVYKPLPCPPHLSRSPETRRFWETVTAKKSPKETWQLKTMMCPGWSLGGLRLCTASAGRGGAGLLRASRPGSAWRRRSVFCWWRNKQVDGWSVQCREGCGVEKL